MTIDRPMPPLNADERKTLESWLDFYRATLAVKCEGLTEEQLRTASVPPSPLTLLGLLQHMAEVERNWFRRVLIGDNAPPIYDPHAHPNGSDGGFDLAEATRFDTARQIWEAEKPFENRLPDTRPERKPPDAESLVENLQPGHGLNDSINTAQVATIATRYNSPILQMSESPLRTHPNPCQPGIEFDVMLQPIDAGLLFDR